MIDNSMPQLAVADARDAEQMLALYAPYVKNTTVSSEYVPPSIEEFTHRITEFGNTLPWLKCTCGDTLLGYGYASPHRARAGYQWSVETSIYVNPDAHRCGVAGAIYSALFELLSMQGYYNIFVGITSPNETSIKFHSAMGFIISGSYQNSMYKFGKWRDVLWMAKSLREHVGEPQPTVPFPALRENPVTAAVLARAAQRIHLQ